jgi:hypothetical protein
MKLPLASLPPENATLFLSIPLGVSVFFLTIPRPFLVIPRVIPRVFSTTQRAAPSRHLVRVFSRFRSPTDVEMQKNETRSADFSHHSTPLPCPFPSSHGPDANFWSGIVGKTATGTWRNPGEWNIEKNREKYRVLQKAKLVRSGDIALDTDP